MDILVASGLVLAVLMMAAGLYLLFRRPRQPRTGTLTPKPTDTAPVEPPPVVPRAVRAPLYDHVADSERLAPAVPDAQQLPDVQSGQNRIVPRMDDVTDLDGTDRDGSDREMDDAFAASITPAASRATPAVSIDTRDVAEPAHALPSQSQDANDLELDHMLSDLDQATAQMVPPVEIAGLDDWSGTSSLLDAHSEHCTRRDEETPLAQSQMIICMQLLPSVGRTLSGERVFHLLRQYGLRFGEMSLFHRFEEANGQGPLMFSVLRYTPDGPTNFDLETMAQEKFDGLTFFLALPNIKAVHGFDMMNSIAHLLARDLSAAVYDEHMTPMSKQLRESYRHQVLEFRPNS